MTSAIFKLDVSKKILVPLIRRTMSELGMTEPYDLEAWLASAGNDLFGREIIWIARQDRPSDEQRSDLLGIDQEGDLLITELKRGEVGEGAITQVLAYAAEYSGKNAEWLANLFSTQSERSSTGLVSRAVSLEDAHAKLSSHVGEDTEVNESQVLLLVGEDFSAKALAICDYLNQSSGEGAFSLECWRYSIYLDAGGNHHFLLEQVLPPPNVRQEIEEKREAAKAKKYARDPIRVEFMKELLSHLGNSGAISAKRSRGQSYECRVSNNSWTKDHTVWFSVSGSRPKLFIPPELEIATTPPNTRIEARPANEGSILEFADVDANTLTFSIDFADRISSAVLELREQT